MDSDKPAAADDDKSEPFKTPEEVAAEEQPPVPDNPVKIKPAMPKKTESSWREKMALHWPPGKKEWITALVILLLIGGGIAIYALTRDKPATIRPIPKVTDQTKTVPSTLTGLPVDPIVNKRTVTGVMIENSIWARPQSGLGEAGVVFEAIAEGGITRFLALYQDTDPANVGPIRSARPYYEQWVLGFDAGYAHVGGSPEALADINHWHVRNLDQFFNPDYYHRVASREAPHNVYTSIHQLNVLEVRKGYKTSHYTGFVRKKKAMPHRPKATARSINFALSGSLYDVHYNYGSKSNTYARSEGGAPHIDANTNKQIKPTVVIALIMHYRLESDGYHSLYTATGSGPVFVFQDGTVTKGTWYKANKYAQFTFKDASGKTIKLNPGRTWLTALSGADRVSYKP